MSDKATYRIIKKVDLPHTKIELRDDDVIQFFYGDYVHYNTKIAQEVEDVVIQMIEDKTYVSLRIAGRQSSISLKLMDYLSRGRGCLLTLADAFVIQSFIHRVLAKIYLKFSKPYVPTRFFENVTDAETWLKSLDKNMLKSNHKLNITRVN